MLRNMYKGDIILSGQRKRVGSVDIYNVKYIADMLNTQQEAVQRWIRSGKLHAKKGSRKDGHVC